VNFDQCNWFGSVCLTLCLVVCLSLSVCGNAVGNISWLLGNAEELPVADESCDVYTVAFGIRNMTHIDTVSVQFV